MMYGIQSGTFTKSRRGEERTAMSLSAIMGEDMTIGKWKWPELHPNILSGLLDCRAHKKAISPTSAAPIIPIPSPSLCPGAAFPVGPKSAVEVLNTTSVLLGEMASPLGGGPVVTPGAAPAVVATEGGALVTAAAEDRLAACVVGESAWDWGWDWDWDWDELDGVGLGGVEDPPLDVVPEVEEDEGGGTGFAHISCKIPLVEPWSSLGHILAAHCDVAEPKFGDLQRQALSV